jgi:predicted Zn-dependent protease
LQAFGAIKAAYDTNPFDSRIRMQYLISLEKLRERAKTSIDAQAADRIYEIAKTASPRHQAVMLARVTYLLNSGRWKNDLEAGRLIRQMRRNASMYPETWMATAFYQSKIGNQGAAAAALVRGMKAGGRLPDFKRVANSINMEIEEK